MRGRKKTPTAILKLRGSRAAIGRNDTALLPPCIPTPPAWLGPEEMRYWDRLTLEMDRLGILTALDRDELSRLCVGLDGRDRMIKQLDAEGWFHDRRIESTGEMKRFAHPLVAVLNRQDAQIRQLAGCFGMTPAGRSRLLGRP